MMVRFKTRLNTPWKTLWEIQGTLCKMHSRVRGWIVVTDGKYLWILSERTNLRANEAYYNDGS